MIIPNMVGNGKAKATNYTIYIYIYTTPSLWGVHAGNETWNPRKNNMEDDVCVNGHYYCLRGIGADGTPFVWLKMCI